MRTTLLCLIGLPWLVVSGCRNQDDSATADTASATQDSEPIETADTADTAVPTDSAVVDLDQDGWRQFEDCDDADATVNPDAEEVCDDIDNDCDGTVDGPTATDAELWFTDGDGDGFGADADWLLACTQPSGTSELGGDCDDDDATVNPAADEVCDGQDNDCDTRVDDADGDVSDAQTWYDDDDGDGHGDPTASRQACTAPDGSAPTALDCDDSQADVNPDATEVCNQVDDDCDGDVDNDATDAKDWYTDSDGDGHGDPTAIQRGCTAPSGTVANATDCDDGDATISPVGIELCDGADNDCDASTDEAGAADADTFYADIDGDGYGDPGSTTAACSQPTDHVADDTDCDDGDAAVSPGASETCNGTDDDCDGLVDDDDPDLVATTWYIDHDGDGHGSSDYTTDACSEPTGYASTATDCDDTDAGASPDGTEACDGTDNDCDSTVDEGAIGDTWYLDSDGDGYGDASTTTQACDAPTGYVAADTDCDDTDASLFPEAGGSCPMGVSCRAILDAGLSTGDDTYTIDPDGSGTGVDPLDVACDMTTDGGGWTAVPYAADLTFEQQFTTGDGATWIPEFTLDWSDDTVSALQAVSTEGRQEYVGLCEHVIHHYYDDGANHDFAFGFRFFDGTETVSGSESYSPHDVTVTADGCSGNGGEGGDPAQATVFAFSSPLVPVIAVQAIDAGDSGESFGSPLGDNPAWLR